MDVGIWETIKKQKRVKQYGVWTLEYEGEKEEKKKEKRLHSTADGGGNVKNNEKQSCTARLMRCCAVDSNETLEYEKQWKTGFTVRLTKRCAVDSNETLEYENRWKANRFHSVVGCTWKSGQELTNQPSERQKEAPEPVISVNRQKDGRESRWRGRTQEHSLSKANGLLSRSSVRAWPRTTLFCESVRPGGKGVRLVSRRASARFRFDSPFSSKRLCFVDIVSWLCPSQLLKL